MKLLHLADLHFRRDMYPEICASLDTVEAEAKDVDLIVLSGDIWDGPVQNTAGSMFPAFVECIRRLANLAPVAMIYGTPSHDTDGSLDVFEQLDTENPIVILKPGKPYYLGASAGDIGRKVIRDYRIDQRDELLLFGVPEPNKKWLLANGEATGKDEADAAVRASMRALFLGLAGFREQHPELPCVLLYHGQVSGARTATGFGVENGHGLAVSRDDLAAVGADYIALGDIHEPQQIGGIPAYYPGSIVPQSWGETHKAGCNLVYIGNDGWNPTHNDDLFGSAEDNGSRSVEVSRIDFSHPQRMKISHTFGETWTGRVEGKLVWVETTATREDAALVDTDALLAKLLANGALPGSRVTLNIIPTETIRAGEITEKKTLREKVAVWGENSSVDIPESALSKADELERVAAAHGIALAGAHIRINKLILRGAKGIWKNQRKDEIVLDLDAYDPGVIAMIGTNGAGKTTILENMHPWPQMLTRTGALKDHFRLRDSCRDLYFTDTRTGVRYRALITVRADIVSGAAEYFLWKDTGAGFEPVADINGRKDAYEAAIESIFGSLAMYLRTAFQTQRPTTLAPDLSETTKGQRKELFAELSGVDYLDAYRAEAKLRADELDERKKKLEWTVEAAANVDAELEAVAREIVEHTERMEAATNELGLAEAELETARKAREALARRVAELGAKEARLVELDREIRILLDDVARAEKEIAGFQSAVEGRAAAESELAKIEALERELETLRAERDTLRAEDQKRSKEFQAATLVAHAERKKRQTAFDDARRALERIDRDIAVTKAGLAKPVSDTCPTCGQTLPADKLAAIKHAHDKAKKKIEELERQKAGALAAVTEAEADLSVNIYPSPPKVIPFAGESRLADIEGELAFTSAADARETIRKADEATVKIDAARTRADTARRNADAKMITRKGIEADFAGANAVRLDLSSADNDVSEKQARTSTLRETIATARAHLESDGKTKATLEARKAEREKAQIELKAASVELADWRLLETACGKDGIQALELDALAPSIATVANRLLAVQSPRYSVEFRTTRIAGKGGKTKQIETFEIFVLDSETGEEQEIGTLSGGEGVWIKRAIYDAFSAIRAQNTGIRFLTVFQDETDGALDPEARMNYLRMLEAAHDESGRHHTILISHSTEIQAMVSQTIDVWALEARKQGEEVAA